MGSNLQDNDTHVSDLRGTIKTGTTLPIDGNEIQNVETGEMFFDPVKEIFYGFDGSVWYGVKMFTTSTTSSTSTSTSTTTTA